MARRPKIHLSLRGYILCDTPHREGGMHAIRDDIAMFKKCGEGACAKCAAKLAKLQTK